MKGAIRTGVCLGVLLLNGRVFAEPAAVVLEQAIRHEQTEGRIDDAMKLYQQLIDDAQADRPAQAEAMYRLAACYERRENHAKAIELLNRLVQQYPEQNQMVGKAHQLLARLQPAKSGTPYVLKTTPAAFKDDVDPKLDTMSITFDQPMTDGSWSWTGGGDTYPKSERPAYDATRTICSRKVTLEPGKVYWVGVNSPSFRNFKSAAGVPAPWYIIVFATLSADGQRTPIPKEMLDRAKAINAAHDTARDAATTLRLPAGAQATTAPPGVHPIAWQAMEVADRFMSDAKHQNLDDMKRITTAEYREGHPEFTKVATELNWQNAKLIEVRAADNAAMALFGPVKSPRGNASIGASMIRHGSTYLIRDLDFLPHEASILRFRSGFMNAHPGSVSFHPANGPATQPAKANP